MTKSPIKYLVSFLIAVATVSSETKETALTPWLATSVVSCETTLIKLRAADLWVGGGFGLFDNGQSFHKTYGETSPGSTLLINADSLFEIGSVSKSFTGVLLAVALIDFPNLKATDPVSKFISEIKNPYVANLTLQQLATHSAGLEDNPSDLSSTSNFDPKNPLGNYDATQLLNYMQVAKPSPKSLSRAYPGGYLRSYSNLGFAILGMVLERIYGKKFDTLLAQRITIPLGMAQTFVPSKGASLAPLMNTPFGVDKKRTSFMILNAFAPAGAIVSSMADMMIYLRSNIEPANDKLGSAIKMSQILGFGWDSLPGDQVLMKNGQTSGFSSFITFDPVTKRGSFELHNMSSILSNWVAALPIAALASKTDQIAKTYQQLVLDQVTNPISSVILDSAAGTYIRSSGPDDVKAIKLVAQKGNFLFFADNRIQGVLLSSNGKKDPFWLYQGTRSAGTVNFNRDSRGNITGLSLTEVNANGNLGQTYTFVK